MRLPVLAVPCLLIALATAPADGADPRIRHEEGRLWVSSRGDQAASVFSEIAEKTGVRFVLEADLDPGPLTIEIEGMDLERAIRNLLSAIPKVAGHTMSYARSPTGEARLVEVQIYGPGSVGVGGGSAVYEPSEPFRFPTPDLRERMERMIQAGVPEETAEKVLSLTAEVQKLQATPEPGSYSPEDLSEKSREQLQPLIDRGVPMERAVQMLLLQERYQETLGELSDLQGAGGTGILPTPTPDSAP